VILTRTPLLLAILEWREEQAQWKKAQKKLKRAVNRLHKKTERRIDKLERRGPREGQTGEEFGNWLLKKQDKIRNKIFRRHRERLNKLQNKETRMFSQYVIADRKRRERELRRSPVPRLKGSPTLELPGPQAPPTE
jgi:hypothetical protein